MYSKEEYGIIRSKVYVSETLESAMILKNLREKNETNR